MTDRNTKIRGTQIFDNTIPESKLITINNPVDGYFLQWNNAQQKFEWVSGIGALTEYPTGDINGSNKVFTLTYTPESGSLSLFLNGLLQEEGSAKDYVIVGDTITFIDAPIVNDIIIASYHTGEVVGGGTATWGEISGTLADQTDLQDALNGKANTVHTHDDRYYTETEVNSLLTGKSDTSHTHGIEDLTDVDFDSGTPTDGQILTYDTGVSQWKAQDPTSVSYKTTFVNGDLSSDKITITHNLNVEHPLAVVYDNNDKQIQPTEITYVTVNSIELDFTGMTPLTGTYKVRVMG